MNQNSGLGSIEQQLRPRWRGEATPLTPDKEPPREIHHQMAEIEMELKQLSARSEDLALRLQPLLAPETPRDEQLAKLAEPMPLSALGETLLHYRNTIRDVRKQLQDLRERIAI